MDRTAAALAAFELVEAVQGEDQAAAVEAIERAEAAAQDWPDVLFLLATARTIHAIVRPDLGADVELLTTRLLESAPGPAPDPDRLSSEHPRGVVNSAG